MRTRNYKAWIGSSLLLMLGCGPLLGLDEDVNRLERQQPECAVDLDCNDGNPCTVDRCSSMVCVADALDGDAPDQTAGDCQRVTCEAGATTSLVDDDDIPAADGTCSVARCSAGDPSVAIAEQGTACSDGGVLCDGNGQCVECLTDDQCGGYDTCGGHGEVGVCGCAAVTCSEMGRTCGTTLDGCGDVLACDNALIDGDESDRDCGGEASSCPLRCDNGYMCGYGTDCSSGFCAGGTCDDTWSGGFGSAGSQQVNAIAVDAFGNTVLVGRVLGTVDFGGGPLAPVSGGWDVVMAKLGPTGAHVWSRRFGGVGEYAFNAAAIDNAGNIVVTGVVSGALDLVQEMVVAEEGASALVTKFDGDGKLLWTFSCAPTAAASAAEGVDVALTSSGDAVVAGRFSGTIACADTSLSSAGFDDVFVVSLDSAASPLMARSYAGVGNEVVAGVAVEPDGGILLAGHFNNTFSLGGAVLSSEGGYDIFAGKVDAAGDEIYSVRFGGDLDQAARDIATNESGAAALVGDFEGAIDIDGSTLNATSGRDVFVTMLSVNGAHQWAQRFGEAGDQFGAAVALDEQGDVIVAGGFAGDIEFGASSFTSNGSHDVFVAKLGATGAPSWAKTAGDAQMQTVRDLAVSRFGTVMLAGDFQGTVNFGNGVAVSGGDEDVFLAALAP